MEPGVQTCALSIYNCPSDWIDRERSGSVRLGSSQRARAAAVRFSLRQHGPDDTRGLGGECHHHDLVGAARKQIPQPRIADTAHSLLTQIDRKSTRLNSSHLVISYAVFCLK